MSISVTRSMRVSSEPLTRTVDSWNGDPCSVGATEWAEGLKRASLRCAEAVGAMNRPLRLMEKIHNGLCIFFFATNMCGMPSIK